MFKKNILLLFLMAFFLSLTAESILITLSNGESQIIPLSEISSLTFTGDVSLKDISKIASIAVINRLNNYPNPFNPTTNISFNLETEGVTKLDIFNIRGQKVKTIFNGFLENGTHSFEWNGTNENNLKVASGVFFYRVTQNNNQKINKMIMIK